MDESIVHAVVSQYPFRVYEWRWLAADYCRLETDVGRKMLRLEEDATNTAWRGALLDELAAQRFRRTPRLLRTLYGDSLVTVRDLACTVTDDLAHRAVGREETELTAAMENLAQLHNALSSLADVPHLQPQGRHTVPSLIQRMEEAKRILQQAAAQEDNTPFARALHPQARTLLARAARAEATLREAGGLWREQRHDNRHLTLGGYHLGMVAWTDLEHLATIDFDHVVWGDPEWDLYAFGRALYEQGEARLLPQLVAVYEGARLQSDADRLERLIGFVGFPFAVARVAARYLQSKDRFAERFADELSRACQLDFPTTPVGNA